jgi:uncharacterized protein (UPF0332 family)
MESSLIDLSKYRFETAVENLEDAKILLKENKYKSAVNRSYYAVFHSLRAVLALDGFDSSKHSGIIAYFNKNYVKNNIFEKEFSKMIDTTYRLREKADYQDFYVVSKEDSLRQIDKAEKVISGVQVYLQTKWEDIDAIPN